MKILYAIQGTGNGHLTRAAEILPILKQYAKVDILISGTEHSIPFPYKVDYQFKGLSFAFGEDGGIDYWKTYKLLDSKKFLKSVIDLPTENYNLVINDYEPVSAWSAKYKGVPCYSLSHQCAVLAPNAPMAPIVDPIAYSLLKFFAPADKSFGFHFQHYNASIYTPLIRKEIRETDVKDKEHYTVYLPSYTREKLLKKFSSFKNAEWQIFTKEVKKKERKSNVTFFPVDKEKFVKSMARSSGVICGAGFETPSEALFLKKKLLVVPMKGQFEQQCNAYALEKMGVTVLKNLKEKHFPKIDTWLESEKIIKVDYKDETQHIIESIIEAYG